MIGLGTKAFFHISYNFNTFILVTKVLKSS